jgi:hypothetical protein
LDYLDLDLQFLPRFRANDYNPLGQPRITSHFSLSPRLTHAHADDVDPGNVGGNALVLRVDARANAVRRADQPANAYADGVRRASGDAHA